MPNTRLSAAHRIARRSGIALALTLAVAGCSSAGSGASAPLPESATPSGRPSLSMEPRPTVPPSDAPVTGEVPDDVMASVVADLSTRTGKDASAATVTTAESVTWPDGSLGCPEPGMMYTQIVTPGYHVVLELDGTSYDYRVAGDGNVVRLCEDLGPAGG